MHCDTGEIEQFKSKEDLKQAKEQHLKDFGRQLLELSKEDAEELKPYTRSMRKNTMRNKPCVCGSGIKFKKCCWGQYA